MFIQELRLQNVRSISELHIDFQAVKKGLRNWTYLLGENGCGKTTLLRAMALLLAGSDALPALLGRSADSWIRYGEAEAVISAKLQTASGELRELTLRLKRKTPLKKLFEINRDALSLLDDAIEHTTRNYLLMGYGASRRLSTDPDAAFKNSSSNPRARSVATLFSPEAVLEPLESWVIAMDYSKRKDQGRQLVQRIADDLMPNVSFHDIDRSTKQLLFKTPDGITPLSLLSDGYQNVAAWCGDLLRSITDIFRDYDDPLNARGILLVDEIDLHLHPVWQRRLRGFLDKTFPNLQFIVTTHSALTVQQADEGELFVLARRSPKASPAITAFEGTPRTMMLHQLLLSPIFNLNTMDSVEVQKKRKQYRQLKQKTNRSSGEKKQLATLKTTLSDLPDMAQGLSTYQRKQTKVLEEINQAIRAQNGGPV